MTKPVACPPAPGLLEGYAARFDDLFTRLAQRRGFREYLAGLLAPPDRNKTLTALAGAEPVTGAQHPAVQRLQFFLSESRWDAGQVNDRRLDLLLADPATAPHDAGVLVIDDSGDRKDGVDIGASRKAGTAIGAAGSGPIDGPQAPDWAWQRGACSTIHSDRHRARCASSAGSGSETLLGALRSAGRPWRTISRISRDGPDQ